jgi:hypothetical protein
MRDGEEPGDDIDVLSTLPFRDLAPVLAMLDRCTELRELVFGHTTRYGKLLEMLRRHPLTKQLHTLGLSQLDLDDGETLIGSTTRTSSGWSSTTCSPSTTPAACSRASSARGWSRAIATITRGFATSPASSELAGSQRR